MYRWAKLALPALVLLGAGCSHPSGLNQFASSGTGPAGTSLETSLRLALATRTGGDVDTAIMLYRNLAQSNPQSIDVLLGLGDALFDARSYAESMETYGHAQQLDPDHEGSWLGMGRVNLAQHQPAEALTNFARVLQLNPASLSALNGSGVAHDLLGNPQVAEAYYRRALQVQPTNRAARNNLGLSLALAGRHLEAVDVLGELVQEPGLPAKIRHNLALAYGLAGDRDAATRVGRMDASAREVEENLAFYDMIRGMNAPEVAARTLNRPPAGAVGVTTRPPLAPARLAPGTDGMVPPRRPSRTP